MILFSTKTDFQLPVKKTYKTWIGKIIQSHSGRCGNINYVFCDDAMLLELNQRYLQHDTYTDIITFDNCEGNLISGDIFISIDRVRENAKTYNVSFDNELMRVMAHGILHLCGFKDKSIRDAKTMRRQEIAAIKLFLS